MFCIFRTFVDDGTVFKIPLKRVVVSCYVFDIIDDKEYKNDVIVIFMLLMHAKRIEY